VMLQRAVPSPVARAEGVVAIMLRGYGQGTGMHTHQHGPGPETGQYMTQMQHA